MKLFAATLVFTTLSLVSSAQYFYNDILTTAQTNKQFALLKENNVGKVTAISHEADGSITQHFFLQQVLNSSKTEVTTTAEYPSTGNSISVSTYLDNKIIRTVDSVDRIKSTVDYTYEGNRLKTISMLTEDKSMNSVSKEQHQWFYEDDLPVKMLVIKGENDTTTVNFVKEEHGNIGEEHWIKKGVKVQNYFYYYDDQHRLTDIVRFNPRASRLLPDFLFTYDENGNVSTFTQVSGAGNYMIWKYLYGPNGLKQKEILFNKEKQLVGTVEFSYF